MSPLSSRSFRQVDSVTSSQRQSRRSTKSTNARSYNPSRGQLASKPVDVFGPSAPRTRRRLSPLSQSPRRRGCRLRSPMRTPACCQPLGSGTVQRRAAVACRLICSVAECAGSLVAGRGTRSSNGASIRRVLGTQPMLLHSATQHQSRGKQNHTMQERNNNQGTSALLSSPMFTHRGSSACCAPTM